jgi:hypothetical protein
MDADFLRKDMKMVSGNKEVARVAMVCCRFGFASCCAPVEGNRCYPLGSYRPLPAACRLLLGQMRTNGDKCGQMRTDTGQIRTQEYAVFSKEMQKRLSLVP